ncbi:tRNA lysidine(34) synthetase TilS [Bifidobacterium vansinderenii]|uniref:tRNA(Ile)-lysidine synthase n=1 Tax=Bifidobacterium vansinderenii TaxID=1984871 RepID=A0A229VYQ0_9BIFI|nr:tRNA lysidine(34) synthetase TilS [Bifidobacterium vansinderenii]OXN00737.1 tRNA(Ile)-lysidine synthetase [Bifidobacterium vansinderenii]
MAYTPELRKGIGDVRRCLETLGIHGPSGSRSHGMHEPDRNAPLVLVACSGGRDSLALASVATTVCGTIGVRCGAVIVDHGLVFGSADVARAAADKCRRFGMAPVIIRRVIVDSAGVGVESAARDARYQALIDVASELGAATVLLAHTRDDQAETVLLGLTRTFGLDSLAGMPDVIDRDGVTFARPFLDLTRTQTTAICTSRGIEWWDDPTNGGTADEGGLSTDLPLRSRIRNALLPYLTNFVKTDMVSHLSRSARIAQRDKDYIDTQAARVYEHVVDFADGEAMASIDARTLADEHEAIRTRVIARTLTESNVPVSSKHVEAIDRLIVDWHGQGAVRLSSGYSASRQNHVILLCHDGMHENR